MAQASTKQEWIEWAGGECPVGRLVTVDCEYRDSETIRRGRAGSQYIAANDAWQGRVSAYRVVSA